MVCRLSRACSRLGGICELSSHPPADALCSWGRGPFVVKEQLSARVSRQNDGPAWRRGSARKREATSDGDCRSHQRAALSLRFWRGREASACGQRESRRPRWLRVHAPTRTQVSRPLMTSVSQLARFEFDAGARPKRDASALVFSATQDDHRGVKMLVLPPKREPERLRGRCAAWVLLTRESSSPEDSGSCA